MVAIKMLKDPKAIKEADEEVAMLEKLNSIDCEKTNLVQFMDRFEYKGLTCLAFEMLDMSLYDYLKSEDWDPLSLHEIRPIAQQLLVALQALKGLGVMHTGLKPDNIMFTNMEQQPSRVKVIDFGLAIHTSEVRPGMWKQPRRYRAPEVFLGNLFNEAIDMWGLGCNLAFLYLGRNLFTINCEYQMMRRIVELVGCPPDYLLLNGVYTKLFFTEEEEEDDDDDDDDEDNLSIKWRLLTPAEFTKVIKTRPKKYNSSDDELQSLDNLVDVFPKYGPEEYEDRKAFLDLLKGLLHPDPALRLSPQQALQHPFITMAHLSQNPKGINYLRMCKQTMRECLADGSTHVDALGEKSEEDVQNAGLLLNAFNSAASSPDRKDVSSDKCGQGKASERDDQFEGLFPEPDSSAAARPFGKEYELRLWSHKKTTSSESSPSHGANSDSEVWLFQNTKTKRPRRSKKSESSESQSYCDKPVAASRSLDDEDNESDLWSSKMIQKRASENVNGSKSVSVSAVSDSSSLDGVNEFTSVWNQKRPKKAASEKDTSQNISSKTQRSENCEPSESLSHEAKPAAVSDARSLDGEKDSDAEVWVLKMIKSQGSEKEAQSTGQIRDAMVNVVPFPQSLDRAKASASQTEPKERPKRTNNNTVPYSRVWAQERKKLDGDVTHASTFDEGLTFYNVPLVQAIVQVSKIGLKTVVVI